MKINQTEAGREKLFLVNVMEYSETLRSNNLELLSFTFIFNFYILPPLGQDSLAKELLISMVLF